MVSDKHKLLDDSDDEDDINLEVDFEHGKNEDILQNETKEDINASDDITYADIDEFLRKGGECGRFQILILLLIQLTMLPSIYPVMIFYYIGYDPPWKCVAQQPMLNATQHPLDTTHTTVVNSTSVKCNSSILYEHDNKLRCELDRNQWIYDYKKETLLTEFDLVCNTHWLDALSGSIVFVGWGIGIVVTGYLSDKFGRKKIMFPCLVLTLIFLFLHAVVTSISQLIAIRLLTGFFFSSPALNHFVMLVEIIGPRKRSLVAAVGSLLWPIGGLLMTLKAMYIDDWRTLVIVCSAPYLVLQIAFIWIPESVRWLNLKGRSKEAEDILIKAAAMNRNTLPPFKLQPVSSERKHGKKASYVDLFKRCKLVKLVLPQAFIWFTAGMVYYALNWAFADIGGDMYLNFMLSFIVELPGGFIAVILMERIGRRKSCVLSYVFAGLSCFAVACIPKTSSLKENVTFMLYLFIIAKRVVMKNQVLRVVFGLLGKLMITMSFSVIYMWSSEIYATVLRSQGMGINIVTSRIGAATSPFIKILDQLHPAAPFILMTICSAVASILCFFLPETLNTPTRETLDDMLNDGKTGLEMKAVFSLHEDEVDFQTSKRIESPPSSEEIHDVDNGEQRFDILQNSDLQNGDISDENDPLIVA